MIRLTIPLLLCAGLSSCTLLGSNNETKTTLASAAAASASAPTKAEPAPVVAATFGSRPSLEISKYVTLKALSDTRKTTFAKAEQVIDPSSSYRAIFKTNKGDITIDLNSKAAPVAVNNFVFLALNKFYDGTRFHRVIDGFMAQGGDPNSTDLSKKGIWGTGGPGYEFMAENKNGLNFNTVGVLGMARSASLSSQGSQFFITLAPANFLTGGYTVFGKISGSADALMSLSRTSSSGAGGEVPISGAVADMLNTVEIQVLQ